MPPRRCGISSWGEPVVSRRFPNLKSFRFRSCSIIAISIIWIQCYRTIYLVWGAIIRVTIAVSLIVIIDILAGNMLCGGLLFWFSFFIGRGCGQSKQRRRWWWVRRFIYIITHWTSFIRIILYRIRYSTNFLIAFSRSFFKRLRVQVLSCLPLTGHLGNKVII